MALKGRNLDSSPSITEDDNWQGPWGKINPTEVRFIHFVRTHNGVEEIWTYPYETLIRWTFKKSAPQQELQILFGGDVITIRGYGLERFLEWLEKKCVERIEQRLIRFAGVDPNGCCVTEIKIEPSN